MEIIRHKTKKVISIIMTTLLLINVCMPILATSLSDVGIGDTIKFTGNSWSYYSSKEDAKNMKNVKGYLKKNDTFDVKEKSDNVLKIESNKYIRYSADYFTVTKKAEKKADNKASNVDFGAISDIGGAVIGGIVDFATSEHTWNILKYIGDIIAKVVGKILDSFGALGDLTIEFPKTEVPEKEEPVASEGSTDGTKIDADEKVIGTKIDVSKITVSNITEGNKVSVAGFSIFDDNRR